MKIVIETNGYITECKVTAHTYEAPTVPYFKEDIHTLDKSTRKRVVDTLKELVGKYEEE